MEYSGKERIRRSLKLYHYAINYLSFYRKRRLWLFMESYLTITEAKRELQRAIQYAKKRGWDVKRISDSYVVIQDEYGSADFFIKSTEIEL